MKAIKKPIVVDVWELDSNLRSHLPSWVITACRKGLLSYEGDCWYISTIEGRMKAGDGDYLIKGIRGELYPCEHSIFLDTYDIVDKD